MSIQLRDYQQECIDIIQAQPPGAYLIQMATGLGKTATFSQIPRRGRVLLLSHREELVRQPAKYYDCSFGVECAARRSSGEEVVSASVQTMARRLERFDPEAFDILITDEAHHAGAKTYRKIYEHFRPRLHLGFTATPNRSDGVRLDNIYQDILFQRDLQWGIRNGYLTDIYCRRVNIGYDLRSVRTAHGDYAPGELAAAMDGTADAVAQAYRTLATGATLIFASSVRHAQEIADRIPGAAVVTGETKKRAEVIGAFTRREIPCLVNCMVFTEGTDMPLVETVIIARPTQSDSLYAQMVGRGLRLHPDKDRLNLIDCVGITGTASLCTAPSLLGVDMSDVPEDKRDEVQGALFDLPDLAVAASDCPQSWIRNIKVVDLWAKKQAYNTHGVNWFRMPDGRLVCSLSDRKWLELPPADELGRVTIDGESISMQEALDHAYRTLQSNYADQRALWDVGLVNRWGKDPATDRQKEIIRKKCRANKKFRGFDPEGLSKGEATQVLNRLLGGHGHGKRSA